VRAHSYEEELPGGQSQLGLHYAARTTMSMPTFVGLQLKSDISLGGGVELSAWIRAAWKRELKPERSVEAAFLAAPGFYFVSQGAPAPRDTGKANAGMKLQLARFVGVFAGYEGEYGNGLRAYTVSGGVKVGW
jgi:outer membrane autotransporter protein